jgi:hypothetical protein
MRGQRVQHLTGPVSVEMRIWNERWTSRNFSYGPMTIGRKPRGARMIQYNQSTPRWQIRHVQSSTGFYLHSEVPK